MCVYAFVSIGIEHKVWAMSMFYFGSVDDSISNKSMTMVIKRATMVGSGLPAADTENVRHMTAVDETPPTVISPPSQVQSRLDNRKRRRKEPPTDRLYVVIESLFFRLKR